MIDPRQYGAVDIGTLPMKLTHVRTLEAFEGPLLAEFQSENGDTYLYHWCDRDGDVSRWIVVRTPTQDLTRYLVGAATLRELITKCRDGFVYLVDIDSGDELRSAYFIKVAASLPDEYIPAEKSFYDAAIRTDEEQQDVFVNAEWNYQQVAEYPRRYLQAYSFNALFGRHGDPSGLSTSIGYRLTTGYVYHTLFANFNAHVRNEKRASLIGVAYSSPGYVRFRVDPSVASDLRRVIARYLAERDTIEPIAQLLARWASEREEGMTEQQARNTFVQLCTRLDIRSGDLLDRVDNVQTAVKALSSYLRRLGYLAENDQEKTAMIVGLKRA